MVNKVNNFLTKATAIVTTATAAVGVAKAVGGAIGRFSSRGGNFPAGAETNIVSGKAAVSTRFEGENDWRVKLSFPPSLKENNNNLFDVLRTTDGLVFPYTPLITVAHSANYQPMDIVHSNYPYLAYQNSKIETINVSAQFYVEDTFEARYWVAAVHFLRTLTKMSFGTSANLGSPPSVVKLSGYGDFVFNNVPVVVQSFEMTLPDDVDYIATGLGFAGLGSEYWNDADVSSGMSWAPVKSTFNIQLHPLYSRKKVNEFNLQDFANGEYVIGKDKNGFI
jgi:hypothetical protein